MKNMILLLTILLVSNVALAETIQGRIHSILLGHRGEAHIIRLDTGRVAYLKKTDTVIAQELLSHISRKDVVEIVIDKKNNFISYRVVEDAVEDKSGQFFSTENNETTPVTYEPTVVPNLQEAWNIFKRLNTDYKRVSECSNRAQVWSYEEYKKHGLKSEKTFVFFTASYMRRVRFNWWFHVAPLITVNTENGLEKRVLDFRYSPGPVTIKEWTDLFVYSKRSCKVTTKFSEYDVNPQTEDCYLINVPMYYWMPRDIHNQETIGKYKTQFVIPEVRAAYGEAFNSTPNL